MRSSFFAARKFNDLDDLAGERAEAPAVRAMATQCAVLRNPGLNQVPLHARQQGFPVVQRQAKRIEERLGFGAATSGNFMGLLRPRQRRSARSSTAIPFPPPVFHAPKIAPPGLRRSHAYQEGVSSEAMGQTVRNRHHCSVINASGVWQMPQQNDLSRSLAPFEQGTTLVAVVELSQSSWLIAGTVPGVERQPLKKFAPDEAELLRVLHRWRDEATRSGRTIARVAVAFEAGCDGFWLARWLACRGIECHIIHSSSVAVSREHRRAKTDRLDTGMLMRVFLGWLRGERGHCGMVAIPTIEEEDAKRPSREREILIGERTRIINRLKSDLVRLGIRGFKPQLRKAPQLLGSLRTPEDLPIPPNTLDEMQRDLTRLALLRDQIKTIEQAREERLEKAPETSPNGMIRMLASIRGVGIETADMLVREVLSRDLRDRRAIARYAGLTGAPDESGAKRREKGLTKSGNARVRRGMIQLGWRFLLFQKESALAQWFRSRTDGVKGARKTKMIVALARKLLVALWRMVTTGEIPHGVVLRQAV